MAFCSSLISENNQGRIESRQEVKPDDTSVYPTQPQNYVFTVGAQSGGAWDLGVELPKLAKV